MNQILTDEEITLIIRECARGSAINRDGSTSHRIARAIEQAIRNMCNCEWRDIETAPKDGTVVLLAGCRKPVAAAWLEDEIDYWHVDDNKLGPFALRGPAPTHWMPLPKPPAARSE